jgi:hypothetical protein
VVEGRVDVSQEGFDLPCARKVGGEIFFRWIPVAECCLNGYQTVSFDAAKAHDVCWGSGWVFDFFVGNPCQPGPLARRFAGAFVAW